MLSAENTTDSLITKLKALLSYLYQVKNAFEDIANDIECKNLQSAVYTLAMEANQYAEEICSQFTETDAFMDCSPNKKLWNNIEADVHDMAILSNGGEIIALCNICEGHFTRFYEDLFNEIIPAKILNDIITYQLYAIKYAFMKIRVLNSMRFAG